MSSGRAIDHIGIAAHSLDSLAARYEGLGFTLTPRAFHPERMGTSNRLVQFEGRNFVELIEVDRPHGVAPARDGFVSFGAYTLDFLKRREGINLIVFRTQDRDADLARWRAAGLDTYEAFSFERLATLPDGSQQKVRFELAFVTDPEIDCLFFVCHNKAEENFWKPDYQRHENGGSEISSITIAAEDPARHAVFLSSLFGGQIEYMGCGISIQCDSHRIDVCYPHMCSDAAAAQALEQSAPIGFSIKSPEKAGQVVPASQAGGAFVQWT